jgi:hypothetical protein
MSFVIDIALKFAGMTDKEIADLEKSLPAAARLATALKQIEPILTLAKPHIDALAPLVNQMLPIFQKAWPDIVSVTPTADELIVFIQGKAAEAAVHRP